MRNRISAVTLANQAPRILGAFFCALIVLTGSACDRNSGTPDWDTPGVKSPATAAVPAPVAPPDPVIPVAAETPKTPQPVAPPIESPATEGLRFITYNVENWLTMDRYVDRKNLKGAPKPESEKQAVVQILVRHAPDVIGLSEIGTTADLAEIQEDLKAAGLDLPHSHHTGGSDPTRHLGLLSRFPITSTAKPAVSEYQLAGQTFAINRGILDATVEARGKFYRFLGVHLKSKRDVEIGDQEAIRLQEARLLRRHVDSILETDAEARLVVYGDFNDTRATPAIKAVTGSYNDPTYLTAIPAKDSNGHAWTYHWALHDTYSRIDFIMVSRGLREDVIFEAAKIIDDPEWDKASDHRPILAIFK
ncbi:MAG: endonuclease/exonuclease/phosphatase family protein [Luteolibacter sp.]